MTRINTNVSSLVAQNTLARSHDSLNQALTRLSTGLRINTGQDDPAGLIASENLRSDITSIQGAISNTDQANEVIGTADSALGQVSSLLNDIRGLVTQSANTGALSDAQIAANQLQVDSSLKALNRIAQTTTFQGRRLLDGSLDFITTAGTGFGSVSDLKIDTANLGSTGSVSVAVNIASAATKAQITNTAIPTATTAAAATGAVVLTHNIAQATGTLTLDTEATGTLSLAGQTIDLKAKDGGDAEAAEGNAVAHLAVTFNAGSAATSYDASTHTLNVSVTAASATATVADVISAIAGGSDFGAVLHTGGTGSTTVSTVQAAAATFALTGGQDAINLTAVASGDADGAEGNAVAALAITFGAGSAATSYDASTHTLNVSLTQAAGTATEQNLLDAINGGSDFTATAGTNASATIGAADDATAVAALTGGRDAGAGTITVTSDTTGVNTHTVTLTEDNTITNNTAVAAIDGSGNIGVKVHGT
ncbi:MAG TPA: flagellin, partial [Lacipirellulaceae bacterium]